MARKAVGICTRVTAMKRRWWMLAFVICQAVAVYTMAACHVDAVDAIWFAVSGLRVRTVLPLAS